MTNFRYSYILDGIGSKRGKSARITVHSLFFCWGKNEKLEELARREAWNIFNAVNPEWFKVSEGEEFETVSSHEARGIGFYYLHILLNDKLVRKVHLRHRLWGESFFDVVPSTVKAIFRWLRGL